MTRPRIHHVRDFLAELGGRRAARKSDRIQKQDRSELPDTEAGEIPEDWVDPGKPVDERVRGHRSLHRWRRRKT